MSLRELSPPCHVHRTPPLNYACDDEALSYLGFDDRWGAARLHEFHDAYASPYGVVFQHGEAVRASVDYSLAGFKRMSWSFRKKIILGRVRRVSGTCVVFHNAFFKNYYHWLLEALPRLFCVRDELRDARLALCSDIEPFHLDTLRLFEFRDIVRVKRNELIHAERLLLSGPVYERYGQHNPALLAEMAGWMKDRCRARSHPGRGRRLYVGRGEDKRRKIVNEEDLVTLLNEHGFDAVWLEGMAFADQVALFSQAEIVAGIHGAGLSNILFMKSGGTVIEFINERYQDACFFNLADACGHRTVVLPCPLAGPTDESGPKYYDMEVELEKLKGYMDAACDKQD